MNMSQAQPTLRSAVEGLPDGAMVNVRGLQQAFCPETTAERARAALEAAKAFLAPEVPAPFAPLFAAYPDEMAKIMETEDVYEWRSVAEVLGR